MEKILEVRSLTKHFGGLSAVSDVDFSIQQGEMVGVIGPNGAGKTTLFSLLTGFLKPNQGEIIFKGEDIAGKKPYEIVSKGIARTFQIVRPFHELTVLENVMVSYLSEKMLKRSTLVKAKQEKAKKILQIVGLGEKLDSQATELPHGDLKRLELAKALATEPELLLLDEPFSGLARHETEMLSSVVQQLNEDGQTIIIIEHKLRELMKLVGRVITLSFGVKIADGTPEEIARNEAVIKAYLGKGGKRFVTS